MSEKNQAAQELGKKGGSRTKELHGINHFKEMAKKSAEVRRKHPVRKWACNRLLIHLRYNGKELVDPTNTKQTDERRN